MREPKHTKGPWTLWTSPYSNAPAEIQAGGQAIAEVFIDESPEEAE